MDGQVREGGNQSKQEHSPMDEQVREGGNQSEQAALTYGWASQGGRESEQASKRHSPKDGQGREGIGAGKGTHQLESADRWAVRTGGKWSEREHSSMVLWMSKSGREGMGVSEQHSSTGKRRGTVKSGREGGTWSDQLESTDGWFNECQTTAFTCTVSHIPKINRCPELWIALALPMTAVKA